MQVWSSGRASGQEAEIWESVLGQYLRTMGLDEITHRVSAHGQKTLDFRK